MYSFNVRYKISLAYKLIISLLVFIWTISSNAQINNNRYRVDLTSQDMGPCGGTNDGLSFVDVLAKTNLTNNFEIAFDLPDGVDYVTGSASITLQQGSSDFTLSEVDISNLNQPIFRIERPGDVNWAVADRVRFRFRKTANCDAVVYSYSGGLFKDAHTITYNDNNGAQSVSDTDPTINSYELRRAYIAVLNYADVNATVGQTLSRTLDITNSGNGNVSEIEHNVTIGANLTSYNLSFNGTPLTPSNVSGTMYTYTIDLNQAPFAGNIGDGDAIFENETIQLTEQFTVTSCGDTNISHQPTWGCNPMETCQLLEPITGQVIVDETEPVIEVNEIGYIQTFELNGGHTYTMQIANTSASAAAYDVNINSGFGDRNLNRTTSSIDNPLYGNDRTDDTSKQMSNFTIGGTGFTPNIRPQNLGVTYGAGSFYIPEDFFNTDPDGPGGLEDLDGDGFFDDLAAGSTTEITYDVIAVPRTASCTDSGFTYVRSIDVITEAFAYNQCNVELGAGTRDSHRTTLNRGTPLTNFPGDMFPGQPFNFDVTSRMNLSTNSSLGRPVCNGIELFSNDPSTYITVTLNVPTGVLLDGTPAGFTQVGPNEIVYTTDQLDSGDVRNLNEVTSFPLILDCGTYTGGSTASFNYTSTFTSSCFTEDIHCATFSNIRMQCTTGCNGVSMNYFESERESLGYTSDDKTTQITPDPNLHNLDTYMFKDDMVIRTQAVLKNTTTDNLFFNLNFETESIDAGDEDLFRFITGNIEINDLSSGTQSGAINNTDVNIVSLGGNNYQMQIDLSSYRTLVSPTYQYGEPIGLGAPEEDEISLELHLRLNEIPTTLSLFNLENFYGEFYYNDTFNTPQYCNAIGDQVSYFRPDMYISARNPITAADCGTTNLEFIVGLRSLGSYDPFPNEYRNLMEWSSISVTLPTGSEFYGDVNTQTYPSSTNDVVWTQLGNTITITPDTNHRERDVEGLFYPRVNVGIRGTVDSPPVSTWDWSYEYTRYPDSAEPEIINNSGTNNFEYTQPEFNISSISPVIIGDNVGATFEVDYCLDSQTAIDFTWLRIANGSNFTITRAYEVSGGVETDLTFTSNSTHSFIQTEQFTSGINTCKKIRFDVDYTQCSPFDFQVDHSWSCSSYPPDFSTTTYIDPYTLRLEPRDAVLQFAILNEPAGPVDMCTQFDIDLELRNAGNANLIDPYVTINLPFDATYLTVNNVAVEYPRGSLLEMVTFATSGNTITLNLGEDTDINSNNGLMGAINSALIEDQIANIYIDLEVTCDFASNTAITFSAIGNNPCGSPATGNNSQLSTNSIIINGAEPYYDAVSTITLPNSGTFLGCTTETVSVSSTIVGGPTGTMDYARIVLPDGLTYEANSFSSTSSFAATFNSVTVVGDHQEILLNMPSGANNGDIIDYTFDVTPTNTTTTCSPNDRIEVYNFVTINTLSCGGISCGSYDVPVGDTYEEVAIEKAIIGHDGTSSSASFEYTITSNNAEYSLSFVLENTGSEDLPINTAYEVYCTDGAGTPNGSPIYNGSTGQIITSGSSVTITDNFITLGYCTNPTELYISFAPSNNNCHCNELNFIVPVNAPDTDGDGVPDYIDLDDDNDGILDSTEDLNSDNDNDPYTNPTDFDGDGIADIIDLDADNDGIPDNVEAQTTTGYIVPNPDDAGTYTANNGVNSAYLGGITPINTDGTDNPDYLDLDSDNEGGDDTAEAQIILTNNDADNDGLDDATDAAPDYSDVGGTVDNPLGTPVVLPDVDNDATTGGDVDFRDAIDDSVDHDGDGIPDVIDLDDDNDGIPDILESNGIDPDSDSDGDGVPYYIDDNDTNPTIGNDDSQIQPNLDIDLDGVPNHLDLDSDNDGIYDAVEAGHDAPQTNGMVNGNVSNDGIPDIVQSSPDSGTINYTVQDSDGDGIIDNFELDSDNDGCNDVLEAGYTDGDANGVLGNNPVTIDTFGVVTSGPDGYSVLADLNTNSIYDYREAGAMPFINTQPLDIQACTSGSYSLSIDALNVDNYQWQVFDGTNWIDLTDTGIYSGTSSNTITITDPTVSEDGNRYRVQISNTTFVCGLDTSDEAILTVGETPVITIEDSSAIEGDDMVFNVNLSSVTCPNEDITVTILKTNRSADDTDYDSNSIQVTIPAGSTTNTFSIETFEDVAIENTEDFTLSIASIDAGTVSDYSDTAIGSILDNDSDIDSDDDGIIDSLEDANTDGDFDPSTNPTDSDGDGVPNYLDIDSDDDGIPDNVEGQTTNGYLPPSLTDTNTNGLDDIYENNGILGITPVDTDQDGTPDYLDLDSDNDGLPDNLEAHDHDMDGIADVVYIGSDKDNDGLDDGFEGQEVIDLDVNDEIDDPLNNLPNSDLDNESDYRDEDIVVDLEILKTASVIQAAVGDEIIFTITAKNNGVYSITNVGIEEVLPAGFTLVDFTVDIGNYDSDAGIWELPTLEPRVMATLRLTTNVTEIDDYTNVAILSFIDQIDGNPINDTSEVTIEVTKEECLTAYNEFSPNGDGTNEVFYIECINQYPDNLLSVYNRWGILVFQMKGYDNSWDGTSTHKVTIDASEKLPIGTYYYTLNLNDGVTPSKAGWLYISR